MILLACSAKGRHSVVSEGLLQEARSRKTAPARLFSLARQGGELTLAVAMNPSAPPYLLAELASHPTLEIREAVAENPSIPFAALVRLGAELPLEASRNPLLSAELLLNPWPFE